jgi:hypothetical protein
LVEFFLVITKNEISSKKVVVRVAVNAELTSGRGRSVKLAYVMFVIPEVTRIKVGNISAASIPPYLDAVLIGLIIV